jgi:hypothetical protein
VVDVLIAVLFVVLVNGACILSFDRAQAAIRDLGAAWVRALSTFRERPPELPPPEEPPRGEQVRDDGARAWLPVHEG